MRPPRAPVRYTIQTATASLARSMRIAGHATFAHRRATCPALNLSTKGAGVGVQTMQTDLLKTMFNDGDKGPPTPPGIRMHGIFAASTGFSVQFFPESVILGCGPDAARAYPYTVVADGTRAGIKIDAPDHPLTLAFGPDGSLDAGSGPYQVHGRIVIGQNDNGDFTSLPWSRPATLPFSPRARQIPSGGGTAATMSHPREHRDQRRQWTPARLSTPAAPLGNATLSIVSGFPAQARRSESARRASLRSSARQLRKRTRKRRRLRPAGNVALQIRGHGLRQQDARLSKDSGRRQSECRLSRPGRRQRQRQLFPAWLREPTT